MNLGSPPLEPKNLGKQKEHGKVCKVRCKFPQMSQMTETFGGATGVFTKTSEQFFTRRCFDV